MKMQMQVLITFSFVLSRYKRAYMEVWVNTVNKHDVQ